MAMRFSSYVEKPKPCLGFLTEFLTMYFNDLAIQKIPSQKVLLGLACDEALMYFANPSSSR